MFRCPHCRERTIGIREKLKANGFRPSACPRCGGKYVQAAWTSLPALFLVPLGMFAPLLLVGVVSPAMMWLLLASGVVLGVLAGLAVQVLITPLLRHGSTAARWEWWSFVGAMVLLALYAALKPSPPESPAAERRALELPPGYELGSMTVSQVDPALHEELKAALAKAGVRFELDRMEDGREALRLRHDQVEAYERVEREIWGERPPADGRSVHMSPDAAQRDFRKWLSDAGIAHRVVTYQRKDYVVWDGEPYLWKKFHAARPSDCVKPRAQVDAPKRC
jgi:hypothetical protein